MSAEFVRDDKDNVWFVFANKIQYRHYKIPVCPTASFRDPEQEKKAQLHQNAQTDLFTRELNDYQEAIESQRESYVMKKMKDFMADYFVEMKKEVGFEGPIGENIDLQQLE